MVGRVCPPTNTGRVLLTCAVGVMSTMVLVCDSWAQSYPLKPIRVVRPHPAGASGDIQARGISQMLSQSYGQAFVIENRVGGDGIIGAEACAKAAPDGYTICSTDSAVITSNPVVRAALPYDPLKDFAPIIHLGFGNSYLLVNPNVPAKNIQEFVAYVRANPGKVNWGDASPWPIAEFADLRTKNNLN